MKSKIKTSAMVTLALLECLEDQGLTAKQIESKTGLKRLDKRSPDIQIFATQLIRLWEVATEVTGDPALTLHLRGQYGKNLTHFIHCIALNSKNGLEALDHWSRYSQLVCEVNRVTIEQEEDFLTITFTITDPELRCRWMPEHTMVQLMDYGRLLIGSDFTPIDVRFRHPCPADVKLYRELFRCPVYFEQETNSFTCFKDALLKEFKGSNPHLQSVLINKAESDLKQNLTRSSLKKRVMACIVDELPKGNLNVESVCMGLSMSRSTLHRRLREEATTFNAILTDVRKELAKSYLKQGMNTSQTAYLLGYSNASNFVNAFKRWFNDSPKSYRNL